VLANIGCFGGNTFALRLNCTKACTPFFEFTLLFAANSGAGRHFSFHQIFLYTTLLYSYPSEPGMLSEGTRIRIIYDIKRF
jgi:hypothetical protein